MTTQDGMIAIIGIGFIGKGIFHQIYKNTKYKISVIADINLGNCVKLAELLNIPYKIVHDVEGLEIAIDEGVLAICNDGNLAAQAPQTEIVIESSNAILQAFHFSKTALINKKNLILVNSEVDLAFGPELMKIANDNKVIYTSCDGDQYGVIKRLVDETTAWGFKFIMAGNIKGYLDRYANPTTIVSEADKRGLDHRMCVSYTDGTKLNIEMALVANCLNCACIVPGMLGPKTNSVHKALKLFNFSEDKLFVDYILDAEPSGGVFIVSYSDDVYQRKMMSYYKQGDGPFYLFYRPYHLCHIEIINTIQDVIKNKPLLQPIYGYKTNVYAHAKTDLKAGQKLDGIGGYCCYGLIDNYNADKLPICFTENAILEKDIKKDREILLTDYHVFL